MILDGVAKKNLEIIGWLNFTKMMLDEFQNGGNNIEIKL